MATKQVDIPLLEEYLRYLYRYRIARNDEPLKLSTQRMRLMAITSLFKRLHYYDIIKSDFYQKFELPRVPRNFPHNIPDEDEIELIIH
ncbi:MAG: hypothetical protein OQK12_08725 [Motiliproteus sp.]|nr:hypothetical protein [Motiliproteus sp.]MCW9053292.1 hypothetical protein [Motiliproteus sp.]